MQDHSILRIRYFITGLVLGFVLTGCTANGTPTGGKLDHKLAREMQVIEFKTPVPAPDFILQSLAGKEVSLTDYRGKILLLNFSTSW